MNDIARELINTQIRSLDDLIQVALERRGAIKEDLADVEADLQLARIRRNALQEALTA
jgi:hypothetical protein